MEIPPANATELVNAVQPCAKELLAARVVLNLPAEDNEDFDGDFEEGDTGNGLPEPDIDTVTDQSD